MAAPSGIIAAPSLALPRCSDVECLRPHAPRRGSHSKAQGIALGNRCRVDFFSPERARLMPAAGVSPFQGWALIPSMHPRALPWATESRPFGASFSL